MTDIRISEICIAQNHAYISIVTLRWMH